MISLKREKGETKEKYEARIKEQWHQAEIQINGYAVAPRVEALRQGTQLHKIIMQFDGYKLLKMDEIKYPIKTYLNHSGISQSGDRCAKSPKKT